MRLSSLLIAATLATAATPVIAQVAAVPTAGKMLVDSAGKRIGTIDRIIMDASGVPKAAAVIYDSRFVYVPFATLATGDKGRVTTTLTAKDVRALR